MAAVLFSVYLVLWYKKPPEIKKDDRIPSPPQVQYPNHYWRWDSKQQKWVSKSMVAEPRAIEKERQRFDEDDIQEYLEKKIPGYKDDTYWGEEWDLGQEYPGDPEGSEEY